VPKPAALPPASGREWLDRAEDAWLAGEHDAAVAAWQSFEREVPESDWTPLDRARVLDGRGLTTRDNPEAAMDAWREALALYTELNEVIRAQRDRGRIGLTLCFQGQVEEGLATGEVPLRTLIDYDEPRRRGGWQDSLATMYTQAGRFDDALRELTALQQRTDIDTELRAKGALMQAGLLAQLGRMEEAEQIATMSLATANELNRSFAYQQRGRMRLALERPQEAVDDLTEAVALAAGTPGLETHVALTQVELARAYVQSGRPLEAAETGEETLRVLSGVPELADRLADVRGVLIDAYRALGELEPALAKVRELQEAAPADAHPAWLGMVRQDEGQLLERLDRDEEAVEVLLAAASYYAAAEQPIEQVQALRLAGQSARYTGDLARAVELIENGRVVLDSLPSADHQVIFQTAGIHWDLALIALQQGDPATAVQQATHAGEHYERGGYVDQRTNARLLIAEHGEASYAEELFPTLAVGSEAWYRGGWILVDRLRSQNREQEAAALEARLGAE
jgi:tetratricopeptide (TPR) repeat protein